MDWSNTSDQEDSSCEEEAADIVFQKPWLVVDPDHPPEYYLQQVEELDEAEFTQEDYAAGSTVLLDRMEVQWVQ